MAWPEELPRRRRQQQRAGWREARAGGRVQRRPPPGDPRLARLPRGNRYTVRGLEQNARGRLRAFRQGSLLAVAATGLLLILWQDAHGLDTDETPAPAVPEDPAASIGQATRTVQDLLWGAYAVLPRLAVAVVLVVLAALAARVVHAVLRRSLSRWERSDAVAALVRIAIMVVAVGAALSVLAGDARALVGSVGLVGLALSWALQTPIESFTGWLMNSFRGYYRVGDRIRVGDVFGDVYKIDVLTTTVWEAGGPDKPVAGAQPTGAMITFPNWEVLRSNLTNYSRDFPYVWDEVTVSVAVHADVPATRRLLQQVADETLGDGVADAARSYRLLLERARLAFDVADRPQVFVAYEEQWLAFTIRYLVDARQRRRWSSRLTEAVQSALNDPSRGGHVPDGVPVREVYVRQNQAGGSDTA